LRTREYQDTDRSELLAILRLNVPKYFSKKDVFDFERYLNNRQWDRHFVYLNNDDRVVGCASCWRRSPDTVSLSWMFCEPSQVGPGAIVSEFEAHLAAIARDLCPDADPTFVFNTTPRVARLMSRLGFVITETVRDGYGAGYSKVSLERKWHAPCLIPAIRPPILRAD
jgi:[ribosomal protein S18]-alanine N-acetyltransferase